MRWPATRYPSPCSRNRISSTATAAKAAMTADLLTSGSLPPCPAAGGGGGGEARGEGLPPPAWGVAGLTGAGRAGRPRRVPGNGGRRPRPVRRGPGGRRHRCRRARSRPAAASTSAAIRQAGGRVVCVGWDPTIRVSRRPGPRRRERERVPRRTAQPARRGRPVRSRAEHRWASPATLSCPATPPSADRAAGAMPEGRTQATSARHPAGSTNPNPNPRRSRQARPGAEPGQTGRPRPGRQTGGAGRPGQTQTRTRADSRTAAGACTQARPPALGQCPAGQHLPERRRGAHRTAHAGPAPPSQARGRAPRPSLAAESPWNLDSGGTGSLRCAEQRRHGLLAVKRQVAGEQGERHADPGSTGRRARRQPSPWSAPTARSPACRGTSPSRSARWPPSPELAEPEVRQVRVLAASLHHVDEDVAQLGVAVHQARGVRRVKRRGLPAR